MEWKCSCKTLNDDNLDKCSNCGRAKPKYFGINIQFTPNETFDNKKLSVWYLKVAVSYLDNAREKLNKLEESRREYVNQDKVPENIANLWGDLRKIIFKDCTNCLVMIDEAEKLDERPAFKNDEGIVINSVSVRSDCHYNLGGLYFSNGSFENAVTNFQKSFDLNPNQFSIYKLALSTRNLPVEGKSVFSSKKTNEAMENKRQQEIQLFKLTIKFSPSSELGLITAQVLKEKYDYLISLADLN
jgi:tetratricopeptide (TPR) repeat protein